MMVSGDLGTFVTPYSVGLFQSDWGREWAKTWNKLSSIDTRIEPCPGVEGICLKDLFPRRLCKTSYSGGAWFQQNSPV